jgi:hypothetical protein
MEEKAKYREQEEFPGYPEYPESDDIYNNQVKEEDINPDTISERVLPNLASDLDRKTLEDYDVVGAELDIPGSELDDVQESLGAEDEENNYYSLGGDNHENLEESSSG